MPEDRDFVLAFLAEEDSKCPGCGLPRDQTFDEAHFQDFDADVHHCWACAERERKQRTYLHDHPNDADGMYVGVRYRPFRRVRRHA